jgi:GNAT superfamily N-acetyltransferase
LLPEWDLLSGIVDNLTNLTNYGNTVCALLCVHEDFQRRGAGTALVRWGIERAAALGLSAYLEATPAGYPLYLTLGFSEIDVMVIKAGMWDGDRDLRFVAMLNDVGDAGSLGVKGELKET